MASTQEEIADELDARFGAAAWAWGSDWTAHHHDQFASGWEERAVLILRHGQATAERKPATVWLLREKSNPNAVYHDGQRLPPIRVDNSSVSIDEEITARLQALTGTAIQAGWIDSGVRPASPDQRLVVVIVGGVTIRRLVTWDGVSLTQSGDLTWTL